MVVTHLLDEAFHVVLVLLVTSICAALLLYLTVTTQPFYRPIVNYCHAAACAAVCWACACAVLLEIRRHPQVSQGPQGVSPVPFTDESRCNSRCLLHHVAQQEVESFLLLLGCPSIVYVGFHLCRVLAERTLKSPAHANLSPFTVSLSTAVLSVLSHRTPLTVSVHRLCSMW